MTDISKQLIRVANVAVEGSRYNTRFVWQDNDRVYATNGVIMVSVPDTLVDMSNVPENLQRNHPRAYKDMSAYLDARDRSLYGLAPKQLRAALAVFDAVGECPTIVPKGRGYVLSGSSVDAIIMGVRM